MLAHEGLRGVEGALEHRDVVRRAHIAEHHGGVAFQPAELRALHRRALERRAELLLRHLQDVTGKRGRILVRDELARYESWLLQPSLNLAFQGEQVRDTSHPYVVALDGGRRWEVRAAG
ncbi:MAG TPA: hypothetical protein VGE02_01210 [Gemmatimonadales bacterium]